MNRLSYALGVFAIFAFGVLVISLWMGVDPGLIFDLIAAVANGGK